MQKFALIIALLFLNPSFGESSTKIYSQHQAKTVSNNHNKHNKVKCAKKSKSHTSIITIKFSESKIVRIMERYKTPKGEQTSIIRAVNNAARKHKIKRELIVALIARESGFHRHAKSSKNAVGLMQVMPLHHLKNPHNIDCNIDKGTEILARYIRTEGSITRALSRYGNSSTFVSQVYTTIAQINGF